MKRHQFKKVLWLYLIVFLTSENIMLAQSQSMFTWPNNKQAALSLTFDDARQSQVKQGTALLDKHGVKATFYVVPENMKPLLDGWKAAVRNGHEIGNHTLYHPCSGNFQWTRDHALEDYSLSRMRNELIAANQQIEELLGVTPVSYAYTCGQKFVGRREHTRSYIPLVAQLFTSGRGFLDEVGNAPGYLDLAQLTGIESDGKDFDEIKPMLERARQRGEWVVLAGHEIAESGEQTTRTSMLEELILYAQDPVNGIWLATVAEITDYLIDQDQNNPLKSLKEALTFHASFDYGYDADFALGSPSLYTAPEYGQLEASKKGIHIPEVSLAAGQGRYGGALNFGKKVKPALYFKSEDNIAYSKESWSGAVSLWLQLDPEKDLEPGYCDPIQITDAGYNDAALWVDFTNKNPRSFRMGVFGDLKVWNPDNIESDENPVFNNRLVIAGDRPFSREQWTHVVISFSGLGTDSAQAGLYVNGKLQGTQTNIPEPFTWDLEKSKIFIGLNYVGLMDEVAIFHKALNEQEVQMLFSLKEGVGELW